jgi:hypothetical protein
VPLDDTVSGGASAYVSPWKAVEQTHAKRSRLHQGETDDVLRANLREASDPASPVNRGPEAKPSKAAAQAAKATGAGTRSLEAAKKLKEEAPERFEKVKMLSPESVLCLDSAVGCFDLKVIPTLGPDGISAPLHLLIQFL